MKQILILVLTALGISGWAQTTYNYKYEYVGGRRTTRSLVTTPLKSGFETAAKLPQASDSSVAFTVQPNPVQTELQVQCSGLAVSAELPMQLAVYTTSGTLLSSSTAASASTSIDFSQRAVGIYVLQLQVGAVVRTWQVVKQ